MYVGVIYNVWQFILEDVKAWNLIAQSATPVSLMVAFGDLNVDLFFGIASIKQFTTSYL